MTSSWRSLREICYRFRHSFVYLYAPMQLGSHSLGLNFVFLSLLETMEPVWKEGIAFANIDIKTTAMLGQNWFSLHRPFLLNEFQSLLAMDDVIALCLCEVGGVTDPLPPELKREFESLLLDSFGAPEHEPTILWGQNNNETVAAFKAGVHVLELEQMKNFMNGKHSFRMVDRYVLHKGNHNILLYNQHQPASNERQLRPRDKVELTGKVLRDAIAFHKQTPNNIGFIFGGDANSAHSIWATTLEANMEWRHVFKEPFFAYAKDSIAKNPKTMKPGDCQLGMGIDNFKVLQTDCQIKNRDTMHDPIVVKWIYSPPSRKMQLHQALQTKPQRPPPQPPTSDTSTPFPATQRRWQQTQPPQPSMHPATKRCWQPARNYDSNSVGSNQEAPATTPQHDTTSSSPAPPPAPAETTTAEDPVVLQSTLNSDATEHTEPNEDARILATCIRFLATDLRMPTEFTIALSQEDQDILSKATNALFWKPTKATGFEPTAKQMQSPEDIAEALETLFHHRRMIETNDHKAIDDTTAVAKVWNAWCHTWLAEELTEKQQTYKMSQKTSIFDAWIFKTYGCKYFVLGMIRTGLSWRYEDPSTSGASEHIEKLATLSSSVASERTHELATIQDPSTSGASEHIENLATLSSSGASEHTHELATIKTFTNWLKRLLDNIGLHKRALNTEAARERSGNIYKRSGLTPQQAEDRRLRDVARRDYHWALQLQRQLNAGKGATEHTPKGNKGKGESKGNKSKDATEHTPKSWAEMNRNERWYLQELWNGNLLRAKRDAEDTHGGRVQADPFIMPAGHTCASSSSTVPDTLARRASSAMDC